MIESQQVISRRIFKRLAMALIKLHVCASWSEPLLVVNTTLFEMCIVLHAVKFHMPFKQNGRFQKQFFRIPSEFQIVESRLGLTYCRECANPDEGHGYADQTPPPRKSQVH